MGQTTFGFGDQTSENNWAFSGSGQSKDDEWEWSSFATGQYGRIVALAARWSGYTSAVGAGSCGSSNGESAMWTGNHAPDLKTGNYGSGQVTGGGQVPSLHNASTSDWWQNNNSYWLGFHTSSCLYFSGITNTGGYTGGNASQGPGAGTNNWGGTGAFGFGTYGTVQVTNVYVRRSGAWTPVRVYVRRAGAWNTAYVYVRRSGGWSGPLNMVEWLQKSEKHIPSQGFPVEVNVGEGWEPGWIVETDQFSWFGSLDPEGLGFDWTKPGHYDVPFRFTGRYNSIEPEEIVEARLIAHQKWDEALRWENYKEADKWLPLFQPGLPVIERTRVFESAEIPDSDPEPILLGCGCI